jgi:hypothetical protein
MKRVCQRFVGKESKARSGQILSAQVNAIETTSKLEGFGSMIGIVGPPVRTTVRRGVRSQLSYVFFSL